MTQTREKAPSSRTNGVNEQSTITILCDETGARQILDAAKRLYPELLRRSQMRSITPRSDAVFAITNSFRVLIDAQSRGGFLVQHPSGWQVVLFLKLRQSFLGLFI